MSTEEQIEKCTAEVRALLLALPSDEARLDVLGSIQICRHCGCDDERDERSMPCQCWNDD
jgi:hypothetical protein